MQYCKSFSASGISQHIERSQTVNEKQDGGDRCVGNTICEKDTKKRIYLIKFLAGLHSTNKVFVKYFIAFTRVL